MRVRGDELGITPKHGFSLLIIFFFSFAEKLFVSDKLYQFISFIFYFL
jgi:hypothetical protein